MQIVWLDGLLKSVVVAAVLSGVVATIGFLVSSATAKKINLDKMLLDKELAAQKAVWERELAEHRARLDRQMAIAKRRAEVAEKVLAGFYRAKRAFEAIRSPMIWAGEMVAEEGVADDVVQNDGYGVIRRVRHYADLFSDLEATRFEFGALFGQDATVPYDALIRAHNRMVTAAEHLLRYRREADNDGLRDHLIAMRRDAFSDVALDRDGNPLEDHLAELISGAVGEMERTCRPALDNELAVEAPSIVRV